MKKETLNRANKIESISDEIRLVIENIRDKNFQINITLQSDTHDSININELLQKYDDIREFIIADLWDHLFQLEREFKKL